MDDEEHKEWMKDEEARKKKFHVPRPKVSPKHPVSEPEPERGDSGRSSNFIDDTRDD